MNRRRPGRPEAGMVTVEIAFAVMAAAVVALGLAYLIALVIQLEIGRASCRERV